MSKPVPGEPKACVFCAIAQGKIPSKKVYEDVDSVAFLDINPRARGMTIVVPRSHYEDIDENAVGTLKVMQAAQTVVAMIKQSLEAKSVDVAIIPSEEVPHFHVRLYPVYGDEKPLAEGPIMKVEEAELNDVASKIKSASVDIFSSQEVEEQHADTGMSEDDARYIRNQLEET